MSRRKFTREFKVSAVKLVKALRVRLVELLEPVRHSRAKVPSKNRS